MPSAAAAQKKQHQSHHHRVVQLLIAVAMMVLKSIAVSCRLGVRGQLQRLQSIGGMSRDGINAFALIKISYLMIKVRLESLLKNGSYTVKRQSFTVYINFVNFPTFCKKKWEI